MPVFECGPLPSREWRPLAVAEAAELRVRLETTALVAVSSEGKPVGYVLVQEEGMEQKPSLLLTMSAADILRYWTLLTQEQKAAFIEARAPIIPEALRKLGLTALPGPPLPPDTSMFANFANIYQAFGNLERDVCEAFDKGRESAVAHRLLGQKYDSLPNLLERADRAEKEGGLGDPVLTFVVGLCAKQILKELRRRYQDSHAEFFVAQHAAFEALDGQIARVCRAASGLDLAGLPDSAEFLKWFEKWFLKRAEAPEVDAVIGLETARQLIDFRGIQPAGISMAAAEEQLRGAVAIHNMLEERGVAYLADEVGMGKTYVALGAVALMRHFQPDLRLLIMAPRRNIQKKWAKEFRNFVGNNVLFPDLRVKAVHGEPARAMVLCENVLELVREVTADPDRDFLMRHSSFSLPLGSDARSWRSKRDELLEYVPWLDRAYFDLRNRDEFKDNFARRRVRRPPRVRRGHHRRGAHLQGRAGKPSGTEPGGGAGVRSSRAEGARLGAQPAGAQGHTIALPLGDAG